ncbi:hypothetical protein PIB30_040608 [Stylosanthes scabra]|uniref:Uncharacterized protein n=1 Tax=Stylosanthes scabra TaxID=79078 RepID=A0ABU6SEJ9_9FABA|nr:hypothetical protein [Stylosanthes scabra]
MTKTPRNHQTRTQTTHDKRRREKTREHKPQTSKTSIMRQKPQTHAQLEEDRRRTNLLSRFSLLRSSSPAPLDGESLLVSPCPCAARARVPGDVEVGENM